MVLAVRRIDETSGYFLVLDGLEYLVASLLLAVFAYERDALGEHFVEVEVLLAKELN